MIARLLDRLGEPVSHRASVAVGFLFVALTFSIVFFCLELLGVVLR